MEQNGGLGSLMSLEERIVLDTAGAGDINNIAEIEPTTPVENDIPAEDNGSDDVVDGADVLVVNTAIDDYQDLSTAAQPDILKIFYDGNTDDLNDVITRIDEALGGQKADSIALATHGDKTGTFLTTDEGLNSNSIKSDADQIEFFSELGERLTEDGRIDMLACNIGENEELISSLETITGHEVAASTDATGADGNWVLERGAVDLANVYFSQEALEGYSSNMEGEVVPTVIWVGTNDDSSNDDAVYDYLENSFANPEGLENAYGGQIMEENNVVSLREAIEYVNDNFEDIEAGSESYVIKFNDNVVSSISLDSELWIETSVTIIGDQDGNGTADITIDGDNSLDGIGDVQLFIIDDGADWVESHVTFKGLILQNGVVNNGEPGGGAVITTEDMTISNSLFLNNTAENGIGGAVYSLLSSLTIDNTDFINNSAYNTGAIYNSGAAGEYLIILNGSDFDGNSSTSAKGSAVTAYQADVLILDSSFTNNNALTTTNIQDGGALYLQSSTVSISRTYIADNTTVSAGNGGALHTINSDVTITGGAITGNSVTDGSSGGIYGDADTSISISGVTFSDNTDNDGDAGNDHYDKDITFVSDTVSTITGGTATLTDVAEDGFAGIPRISDQENRFKLLPMIKTL